MPLYNFEATYTFTTADSVWGENEEDAKRQIETLANIVYNGYSYSWDDIQIDEIWEDASA
jgi:hypothetical protein